MEDDEATTTKADESWEEGGSSISKFEPGTYIQPFRLTTNTGPDIERQEASKERDKRLLRQYIKANKFPNLRNKFCQRFKNQTQLDSIREKVDEDDNAEIVKARMMKMARISREVTRKKPCHQPTNSRRIKRVRITGTWINCAVQIGKWWIMTASMQPYTCAANRYAKFGSNRRFKPGD